MARNIEIKARVPDLQKVRKKAVKLTSKSPIHLTQTDTFFNAPHNRLKLREFPDGTGELIYYERPDKEGPKESSYFKCPCHETKAHLDVITRALGVRGVVKKKREVYLVGTTRIHLDLVEGLGSFVELETVLSERQTAEEGEKEALRLMRALGIPKHDLVAEAYIDLIKQ